MKNALLAIILAMTAAIAAAQSNLPTEPMTQLTINADDAAKTLEKLEPGNYNITITGDLKGKLQWTTDEDQKIVCKPEHRWTISSDVFL